MTPEQVAPPEAPKPAMPPFIPLSLALPASETQQQHNTAQHHTMHLQSNTKKEGS